MKNTLLLLLFFLVASIRLDAQQVVFDPATYDAGSLPAGMTIVDIGGTAYLQVVLAGWNSYFSVEPVVIADHYTNFNCMVKYAVGTSGFALSGINTFLKVSTPGGVEQAASGAASTANFAERSVALAVKDTIGIVQIAGQETTGWSAVSGDTLWLGAITLVDNNAPPQIEYIISRETFGTADFDTNNPRRQPTGYRNNADYAIATAFAWDWPEITGFTSTNGHIEGGYDSSVRINQYDALVAPAYWRTPSGAKHSHMAIRTGDSYRGSWDTLQFLGVDISNYQLTALEFGYGRARTLSADTFHRSLNVEYRIDGGDWMQADTSLIINANVYSKWDYIVMPFNYIEASTLDVRFSCLQENEQIYLDDITVVGMGDAPAGVNDFTVANVIVGTVADAADYTCNLHAVWDADSMYMNFVIADDSIVRSGANYQIDNLEVYFDMDNSKNIHWPRNAGWTANDPTYDTNDWQLRLVADSAYNVDNPIAGAKVLYEITDTGYNFTLNIAWEALLEGFVGASANVIGFDVLASDNDATSTDANRNQITLNSPTDKPFNDPSLFGTLLFQPNGRFDLLPDEVAPPRPENLVGVNDSATVSLTWDASIDAMSAVMSYQVYQGATLLGSQLALQTGNHRVVNDLAEGNYQFGVAATDNYGNASTHMSIYVDVIYPEVGITPEMSQEFNVYPNPATSVLNVVAAGTIQNIQVISITGTVVMNVNNVNQLDLSGLKSGLYMIKVSTETDVYSTTFVRE
jgi:hypothetical protein